MSARSSNDNLDLLAYFGFTTADETHLARARVVLARGVDDYVRQFYQHLRSFPAMRGFLRDEHLVARLQRTQAEYILSLGQFSLAEPASLAAYVDRRLRVGQVHHRVGLEPRLYLGAYCHLGEILLHALAREGASEAIPSVRKMLHVDSHLAIEAYQLGRQQDIEATALTDELTGLPLRKNLVERLNLEVARAQRFAHPFSLMFIDVDEFKQTNDAFGHKVGDAVLAEVATILKSSIRPVDLAGRYGGDEFLVGLVEADLSVAQVVAERIRERAESLSVQGAAVSLSIGLASMEGACSAEELIANADATMYASKTLGRNRVSITSLRASAPVSTTPKKV